MVNSWKRRWQKADPESTSGPDFWNRAPGCARRSKAAMRTILGGAFRKQCLHLRVQVPRDFQSFRMSVRREDGHVTRARTFSIAAQILHGVSGISRCAIPNGARASSTACTIVGGAPIVPLSPIPFTPSGLVGEGVS